MARIEFPSGFHWGTATASYQIEGAWRADGKGESIWDRFSHTPGRVKNGDTGDTACDSFHRYEEDIALLREMNLSSYRFSIAWPRIQAEGRGQANQKGLDYYGRLTDALLQSGIRPFPTLYHWDLPQALEEAGGWPHRDTAGRFADYAEIVISALGDRISDWMIFNEPAVFTALGYYLGIHAPGRSQLDDLLQASHTVNLAQGLAFAAMKAKRSDAFIGTAHSMSPCAPAGDHEADQEAAERWHGLSNLLYLEPALNGRYPDIFPDGLPAERMGVQEGDMDRVRAPMDFIGINLYTRTRVAAQAGGPLGINAVPVPAEGSHSGPKTDIGWEVWPDSLYDMLMRITRDYDSPVIEVTENGCAYNDNPNDQGVIKDFRRIEFYRGYLEAVSKAISQGADVRGYHAWSLLDNFEWAEGYDQRFGLTWVDFQTGERTLKESARWYGSVAAENGFST
ncbi:GH1 family beta-glucosidase [Myxococcota bacterium]|nr:GH1 family beta-glucosidase [Myxococcota bacterium]